MNRRKKLQLTGLVVASATLTTFVMAQSVTVSATATAIKIVPTPKKTVVHDPPACGRAVDLVICLDTSGSMTGLIDSARAKLWDVVNEVVAIEPNARLRVGLLTYGSPHNSTHAQGWIYRHCDLTTDLDAVYGKMMSMSTNGGAEYVGWVLNDAVHTLSWSREPNALRLIYVARNESADQAAERFNFREVAKEARKRGITINSIYAGPNQNGLAEAWDQVAQHGGGDYFAISQDAGTVQICTPHDRVLIKLNAELNATYIPFGPLGHAGKANQVEQDANASKFGEQSIASRAQAKASAVYVNKWWDLVDAANEPGFELEKVDVDALPAAMKKMSPAERKDYVQQQQTRRNELQENIGAVGNKRARFLRDVRAKRTGPKGFDDALRESIRRQAGKKKE